MSFHGLPNHRLFLALMGIEKCRQRAFAGWPSNQIWPKHITSGKQCSKSAFPQLPSHPMACLPAGWPSRQFWPKHITVGKQCSKSAFPQLSSHPMASLPALGLLVALCWDGRLKTNRLAGWPKLSFSRQTWLSSTLGPSLLGLLAKIKV